jgi:hypothetical protein
MGRVKSDVVRDQKNENYRKVYVQWWVHVKKGAENVEELYHNCWLSKWKSNHVNPKQWVEISCVAFYFSVKSNIILMRPMHLKKNLILMQLTIILVHCNCRSNFL